MLQLRRHRRIDRLVAAFDVVAQFACERGDAAHEGAGDAEDVQFHGSGVLGGEYGDRRANRPIAAFADGFTRQP